MRFAFIHQLPLEERLTSSLKKSAEPMDLACNIWPGPVPSLKHSKKTLLSRTQISRSWIDLNEIDSVRNEKVLNGFVLQHLRHEIDPDR